MATARAGEEDAGRRARQGSGCVEERESERRILAGGDAAEEAELVVAHGLHVRALQRKHVAHELADVARAEARLAHLLQVGLELALKLRSARVAIVRFDRGRLEDHPLERR